MFLNSELFSEKINFSSANPFSFNDIIERLSDQEEQLVSGDLKFPETLSKTNKKYPLVIGVAGSLGWKKHHLEQLEMYRNMGIATFELHSFSSRGVESTVGTQIEVTTAMLILDSYKALDELSKHPNIDTNNTAITGWSLGGATTLFSGWIPIVDAIAPNNKFSAHLSYYPPCIVSFENANFTDSPIHILIGEIDDWTPAIACEELVSSLSNEGINIDITVFQESHHSFDSELPLIYVDNGYSLTDCRFKLREDGAVLMNFLGIPMTSPILQKIGLSFCASRGTTIQGNPIARESAHQFSKSFMQKHLMR